MRIPLSLVLRAGFFGAGLSLSPFRLPAQDAATELLASDRAASTLSSDSGLVAALARTFDRQGVLLWPGAPVVEGREEVMLLLRAIPSLDTVRLTWQPLGTELSKDSTLGITWGVAVMTPRLSPGAPRVTRYTAAWRRDRSRWSISALLFTNATPAAADIPREISLTKRPAPTSGPAGHFVAADRAFARLALDSGAPVAFRTWASPDAIISGGGGLLVRGPAAIANGVVGPALWRWHPVAAGASRSGDLGWTVGEAVIAPERGDTSFSKYLTVWTRPPEGPIRFLIDGGNARPATSQ